MNLDDVYRAIAHAESVIDAREVRLDGENVWLPARDVFIRPFFEHRERVYRERLRAQSHTDPFDWSQAPRDLLDMPTEWRMSHGVDLGGVHLFNTHGHDYDRDSCDVLLFHQYTDYGEIVDRRIFNRVNDGLVELVPDDLRVAKVLKANATAPLMPYFFPTHMFVEHEADQHPPSVSGEDDFTRLMRSVEAEAARNGDPHLYREAQMLHRLRLMFWRVDRFRRMLGVLQPRVVFLSSYSNIEREAMIVACWREGIRVVDVEHGFMGPFSPYGRLGFVDGDAPNRLLPSHFWTWGPVSRDFVRGSLGGGTRHHDVLVGGSTWHQARRSLTDRDVVDEQVDAAPPSALAELTQRFRHVVLFCWQPDMLVHNDDGRLLPPDYLAGLAQAEDVLLLMRLHPRSHHLRPDAEREIRRAGVRDYEVELSTTTPLPALLPLATALATSYSTVAFEANALGIPVQVVDHIGSLMMADHLDTPGFALTRTPDEVADAMARQGEVARVPYMSTDPQVGRDAVRAVLSTPSDSTAS